MVYHKTAAGTAEIQNRQHGLRAELRRLLIMIDGKSPLSKFAPAFPGGDISALARELATLGLIAEDSPLAAAPPSPAVAVAEPAKPPAVNPPAAAAISGVPTQPTVEQFFAARKAAVRFVNDNLGPSGETLALKLERCSDPDQLRQQVQETKVALERFLGASAGQRFMEYVRGAVNSAV